MKTYLRCTVLALLCCWQTGSAQIKTLNKFICGIVNADDGRVTVRLSPGNSTDPQLDFSDHSYFTCQIGSTFYTNNDPRPGFPSGVQFLNQGNTIKIDDTIRTTWANKNGVDIIQDIYPVAFPKSGQIVYVWKFRNHSGVPINISCQYEQDVQITDPGAPDQPPCHSNSTDGPTLLTRWSYKSVFQQFPDTTTKAPTVPWFYIGFLYDLPNAPTFKTGLSGQGYTDFGYPLNLIKPFRMTIGRWDDLIATIYGQPPTIGTLLGTGYGHMYNPPSGCAAGDDAVLLEFSQQSVPDGKTVAIGKTSYGTGEFETCSGTMFGIAIYPPEHFTWFKSPPAPFPGHYVPNPLDIQFYEVNPDRVNAAADAKLTLSIRGSNLTLCDSTGKINFGLSQTLPAVGGQFIQPGGVGFFEWWAQASQAIHCTGPIIDTLVWTGSSTISGPPFINPTDGASECDHTLTIDCTDADLDPPEWSDTLLEGCHSASITVHDWRTTDDGLQSITWQAANGTDPSKFIISGPTPAIKSCFSDKQNHLVTISKIDSTASGCFDFTFTDCLGHQSYHTVCLKECPVTPHPDSLPPLFTLIKKWGTYDSTLSCDNNRVDSFMVTDNNKNDSGICILDIIPGRVKNMKLNISPFSPGAGLVRFSISVMDSMLDGDICLRATDCSKEAHVTDTCFHYCTINDTLAPRITIVQTGPAKWHVTVVETAPWDRLIDTVFIVGATTNIIPGGPIYLPLSSTKGASTVEFDVQSNDTTEISSFCIEANDLARNRSLPGAHCIIKGISTDSLCPNINMNPLPSTNPTTIWVTIDDNHHLPPPNDSIVYVWDTGVDSVWFTNNQGMNVTPPVFSKGAKTIDSFKISVIDPTKIDTLACVTINAMDRDSNICSATYCYPYTPDTLPPVITLWYNPSNRSEILGVITDNTTFDRGLDSAALFHNTGGIDTNLIWPGRPMNGLRSFSIDTNIAIMRDSLQSSTGMFWTIDRWGFKFTPLAALHTSSVGFALWVQNFKMKPVSYLPQGSEFAVPVYFVKNDSLPVKRKGITDLTFSLTITGDTLGLLFDGVTVGGTEMETANWSKPQWNTNPTGTHIRITCSMGTTGVTLDSKPLLTAPLLSDNADSVLILNFHFTDQSTHVVKVSIDSVQFNNGRDTLYVGTQSGAQYSTALMPAPQGLISGGSIAVRSDCSPQFTDGTSASSVSLDPPHPNPFSHTTTFSYTVAGDGPVKLGIYDDLGQEMKTIVNEYQKQGNYSVTFDGSSLGSGSYVARLESGGAVCSRRLSVEK